MPIIFAQAIMFVPITLVGFSDSESLQGFAAAFTDFAGFWYNLVFFFMIVILHIFIQLLQLIQNKWLMI